MTTDQDGNGGQPARRYVLVDHDGKERALPEGSNAELAFALLDHLDALPVGGRVVVTRVS